ncbi:hypothetical protein ABPG74_020880 [Tetrahymena malaccensis]
MNRNNYFPQKKQNNYQSEPEKKEVEFQSNPFKFQKNVTQAEKTEEEPSNKQDDVFNKYFFNIGPKNVKENQKDEIAIPPSKPIKAESPKQDKKDWNGDFYHAEINEILIPIPTFVNIDTLNNLFLVLSDVQKQVDDFLNIPQLKKQTLNQIHKNFINKNEQIIENFQKKGKKNIEEQDQIIEKIEQNNSNNNSYNNIPNNQRDQKFSALNMHVKKENEQYDQNKKQQDEETKSRQSNKSKKSYTSEMSQGLIQTYKINSQNNLNKHSNELKEFFQNKISLNKECSSYIRDDILQQTKIQQQKQQMKNKQQKQKNPCLFSTSDYEINQNQIEQILNAINDFGVDKCLVQEKNNSYLKTPTVSINFKKDKILKTIIYSILYRFICQQEIDVSKKFIYKILGYINPKQSPIQSENILLRHIFLHFLLIFISNLENKSKVAIEFLNDLFSFEFVSSLIVDHLFNSAKIVLKISQPVDHINEKIEILAKCYFLNLYLTERSSNKAQKWLYKRKNDSDSSIIFIYFEQSLVQLPSFPVYYVIHPNDQLLALHNTD